VCAQEAYWELELDRVLVMPVGVPSHRTIDQDPGPGVRLRLCEAATEGVDWLTVSSVEVDRAEQTYTVDTLELLHEQHPEDELWFILGADQALRLPSWRDPQRVVELAQIGVAERAGVELIDVVEALQSVRGEDRLTTFPMPRIDVSSTEVRERVVAGRPYRFLVPERVADLIESEGLYR
jgi:nicotinate-nucleotide adenylyltransferase